MLWMAVRAAKRLRALAEDASASADMQDIAGTCMVDQHKHCTSRYCRISEMYGEAAADALGGSSGSQAAARAWLRMLLACPASTLTAIFSAFSCSVAHAAARLPAPATE